MGFSKHGRRFRLRLGLIASCVLAAGLLRWFAGDPARVERSYASTVGPSIATTLARASSPYSGSVAEVLGLVVLIAALGLAARGVVRARRRERSWISVVVGGTINLLAFSLSLGVVFYMAWGLNYYRVPLIERLGWQSYLQGPVEREDRVAELRRYCELLIAATNRAYEVAQLTDPAPVSRAELDRFIEAGYSRLAVAPGPLPSWTAPRARAKPLRASLLLSYLGLAGIYLPWTGEAGYNRLMPDHQVVTTMAHEKAHQRGIASEDEASFVGILACLASDHAYVRYAGLLFAQQRLLGDLFQVAPDQARELMALRHPGIRRDVEAAGRFWARYTGLLQQAGESVNDTYLKLHGVAEGVGSYDLVSRLLLAHGRRQGDAIDRPPR